VASGSQRRAPDTIPDQLGWIGFAAALLLAQQIASKATRDALFLASFDPRQLPSMMIAGAAASLVAIVVMSRALARWGPLKVLPVALGLSASLYVIEWLALPSRTDLAAVILYLHVSAIGSVLVSAFWTMVSEHRDPHATKRLVARVAALAALGATLGGLATNVLSRFGGARATLLVLAVATLAVAASLRFLRPIDGREHVASDASLDGVMATAREVWAAPYLRSLAGMSAIVAMWQAMLDFAFKTAADRALADEASLVAFFGLFYTGTSLLTFVVQTALGKLAVKRGGLAATLVVSPVWVVLSLTALAGTPFALLAALRGGESVLSNSFLRSGYEALFSPLPASVRRSTKAIVDVAATRVGDAMGSLLVLFMVDGDLAVPLVFAAALGSVGVWIARRLTPGYVAALTDALREGVAPPDEPAKAELAGRRALSDSAVALDRERVLAGIAALGGQRLPSGEPDAPGSVGSRAFALTRATEPELTRALAVPLEPELARIALPLLARDDVRRQAEAALRVVAPRAIGSFLDELLDPRAPFAVRLRVPRLLVGSHSPLAIEGLLLGLGDARLEIRMQCARALSRMRAMPIDRERVLAAVLREILEHGASWSEATAEPSQDDDDPLSLDVLVRAHASRSLQYVLVLLSVVTEPSQLENALAGLSSTDPRVRGTALELLDNVVPEGVRQPLLAALEPSPTPPPHARHAVLADLLRSQEIAIRRVS
jgi:AAA family ATP:ADP antiporter